MIPQSLPNSGFRIKPKTPGRGKSTAYYIFDPEQTHLFQIDHAHFTAMNQRFNTPLVTTGSRQDMERIASEMASTAGTIWTMVEQFVDGAKLAIPDNRTAAIIYKRILAHFEEHFTRMKTDKNYEAPDVDDFRNMAEFATCIRAQALMGDPDVEEVRKTQIRQFFPTRASFSNADVIEAKEASVVPKSVKQMDNIERWLEMQNGG